MLNITIDKNPPDKIFVLCVLLALFGLYLVLSPDKTAIDLVGSLFSLAAATFIAINLFINNRLLQKQDAEVYGAQLMVGCFLVFLLLPIFITPSFPETTIGWLAVLGGGVITLLGQIAFFRAIQRRGALDVSIYMKLEPVVTLFAAYILLQENLTLIQITGASLVIGAIILNSLDSHKKTSA